MSLTLALNLRKICFMNFSDAQRVDIYSFCWAWWLGREKMVSVFSCSSELIIFVLMDKSSSIASNFDCILSLRGCSESWACLGDANRAGCSSLTEWSWRGSLEWLSVDDLSGVVSIFFLIIVTAFITAEFCSKVSQDGKEKLSFLQRDYVSVAAPCAWAQCLGFPSSSF